MLVIWVPGSVIGSLRRTAEGDERTATALEDAGTRTRARPGSGG